MKPSFVFLFLFSSLFSVSVISQSAPVSDEQALLWEISGKGLSQPSYLYGTIHMIGKSDFFLTEPTREAFQKARRVTFEIDLEEMMDFSVLMPLLMQSFMKNDTTLRDLLSPEEYQEVKTHFVKLGLPMVLLDRIKPMFLSALDPQAMMSKGNAEEEVVSYEMEFMKMAEESEKPVDGLETAAFQMSMFDSIPYRVQAKMLIGMVQGEESEDGDTEFRRMVELYKNQDIQGMQDLMDGDVGIAGYENLLLVNRNRKWIPVMEKMMNEKPTFFAVGAGHLGGNEGVIQLLRNAGYALKPMK